MREQEPKKKQKNIVILGPTASGKSKLAVEIAKKFNGEVISADSRQVYKGLNIGTGKITKKEMGGIPHHCIDFVNPKRTYTVAEYKKCTETAIVDIASRGKIPIICGGTGLYIDAVVYGLDFPEVKPNPALRKKLEKLSVDKLFLKLRKLDPRRAEALRLSSGHKNPRRLVRALEIVMMTGEPVPDWENKSLRENSAQPRGCACEVLWLGIQKSPEELRQAIGKRLYARMRQGLIREVKNLHKKYNVGWQRLDSLGLEYRYVARYLQDTATKKEMLEQLEREIWRYAKRQMTWFKRNKNIKWVSNKKEALRLVKKFIVTKSKGE